MGEIYTDARSSDHVDESKSTRLLCFRLVLGGKCQIIQRANRRWKIQVEEFRLPVLAENYLGLMEYFLRTYVTGDLPEDPGGPAKSKH